jgi:predicted Rossmann-fold nucleotide-binding protein
LTWAQIGLHQKPVGLLNSLHYYDPLVRMVDYARSQGFIYDEHRALFVCEQEPEKLLDQLDQYSIPSGLDRWLTRSD